MHRTPWQDEQTTGSEQQCNDQEHEERPSCVQIMKKLFFSLILGTLIAICWIMVLHTLKWIAIRGNEFELLAPLSAQQQQSANTGSGSPNFDPQAPQGAEGEVGYARAVAAAATAQETHLQADEQPSSLLEASLLPLAASATQLSSQGNEDQATTAMYSELRAQAPNLLQVHPPLDAPGSARRRHEDGTLGEASRNGFSATLAEKQLQNPPSTQVVAAAAATLLSVLKPALNKRDQLIMESSTHQPIVILDDLSPAEESLKSADLMNNHAIDEETDEPVSSSDRGSSSSINKGVQRIERQESVLAAWPSPIVNKRPTVLLGSGPAGAKNSLALLYKAPFFTSWFVSSWNILFMPIFTLISSCCFRNEDSSTKKLLVESISQFMDNGLTTLEFLGRCAFFSVLWIGTIFGIVYSLSNIDATVVMALFACSAALVYLLSWVLLHQQFVGVRIVAVIICTTGIALLAYMDNSRTLGSVLIVAGSALCSAIYKVIYQRMFGFWSIAQMSLFFTLIGLFNAFLMWPIALLLYFFGVELIVWHYIPWMHLTAAGALHLTANIIAYFGPICSYDIFLTMGLLLAVILSAVIDVTFYKITFLGMKLAGVLLLMIGFLVCLLPENWNEFLYDLVNERFVRWKKQRNLKKNRNKVQDLSTGQMSRLRTPSGRVK